MKRFLFSLPFCALFFLGCPNNKPCITCPTPIDTTSHAFTWQTFTWGGGGASSINDVAIISNTNILAAGEILIIELDSLGQRDYRPYGLIHWNGTDWKLLRIFDDLNLSITPIRGVFISSANDFWFAAGSIYHWNGISSHAELSLSRFDIPNSNVLITKIWGTSSSNLYGVGTGGIIVHYNGSSWQKLESGTTFNFQDIYGAKNSNTGEWEILALAAQHDTLPIQTQLLQIQGTTVIKVETFPTLYFSVWFVPGRKYFLSGDGILFKNRLSDTSWIAKPLGTITNNTSGCIRGNNLNDFFVSQLYLDIIHYNGSTWYDYVNEMSGGYGSYQRTALRGNTMVAGGWINQDAILLLGKR